MTLRRKTLLIIGATFYGVIVLLFFLSRNILLESYVQLEEQNTRQNVERGLGALSSELDHLGTTTSDWAAWDDTYAFIEDADAEYIASNLGDGTFVELGLNLMMFIDTSGQTVFGKAFDLVEEAEMPVPQSLKGHLAPGEVLITHADIDSALSGILLLVEGPMLVASRPILTSENEGPILGTLLMGRYLDATEVGRLAEAAYLPLALHRFDDPRLSPELKAVHASLSAGTPILVQPLSDETVAGYTLMEDIYGKPGVVLRVDMPRDIYQQGQGAVSYIILTIVGVGLVFGVATVLLLERQVLSRLSEVSQKVRSIGTSGDLSTRVTVRGSDELAGLGATINGMLAALQESEGDLRESESRYRLLAENVSDVILTTDLDLKFTYISPSVTAMLGYAVEEAKKLPFEKLLAPDSLEAMRQAYGDTPATDSIAQLSWSPTLELELRRRDGSPVWVEITATSLPDARGKPIGYVGVGRDITERRRARRQIEQAAQEWRGTFDSISDLISIHDGDSRIMRVNMAFARAFKMRPQEVIGKTCYELMHGSATPWPDCPHQQMLETGKPSRHEFYNAHLGMYMEAVCSPILNDAGEVIAAVHIARDITERKQAETRLEELWGEEKKLRQELEAEINKRVEFTRALVHELKTPITPVLASSELLLEELEGGPLLDLAQNINHGACNLNLRIDELLDLARGEIGMLRLCAEAVDPKPVLQKIVDSAQPLALKNGHQLRFESPASLPLVWADAGRLRQVVQNLINNAFKFTPSGGEVTLCAHKNGSNLVVEVQDTGRGISEEQQQRLFEPYQRVESEVGQFSGLGLGLSLAKMLVELHGGEIWVQSQKSRGSIFGFTLPLKSAVRAKKVAVG
jgi:PAS domain S-box-containing protein